MIKINWLIFNVLTSVAQTIRLAAADCDSAWEAVRFVQKMIQKLNSDPESMLFIGEIADFYPRFETRAIFLDHARNFHGKETVMELLEVMSGLGLNQLHMRLSDDEGWRLEIDGLEELTTIGANRCHDPSGLTNLNYRTNSTLSDIFVGLSCYTSDTFICDKS